MSKVLNPALQAYRDAVSSGLYEPSELEEMRKGLEEDEAPLYVRDVNVEGEVKPISTLKNPASTEDKPPVR